MQVIGGERGIRTLGIGYPIHWFSKPIRPAAKNGRLSEITAEILTFWHANTASKSAIKALLERIKGGTRRPCGYVALYICGVAS